MIRASARPCSFAGEEGFTLLELLVVLVILALLAAIATPQVIKYLARARVDTAKIQVDALSSSLELFYLDNGRYPTQEEGLNALVTKPAEAQSWSGPYLKHNSSLVDPWGTPYQYRSGGEQGDFEVKSLGADKAEGGTGDAADITSKH
jgi:general secretion pathway protein G